MGRQYSRLDDAQLAKAKDILSAHELGFSSIGSPIGKIFVNEDFEPHLERMRHAADVSQYFDAPYVRIFSFFVPAESDSDSDRDEVLSRMSELTRVAAENDVILLHENEKEIYGDIPRRCLDIVESVGSPNLKVVWDAANFVQVGVRPFTEGYAMLRPYLEYVQIKDAILATGEVVAAGNGDGEVVETIRELRRDGFDGFFSLEPHLSQAHALGGFSGPELFTEAWKAFTEILKSENIPYA
jgi:sugar phosphate isomerase/epimerase